MVLGTETSASDCLAVATTADPTIAACIYTAASPTTVDADVRCFIVLLSIACLKIVCSDTQVVQAQACARVVIGEETSGDECRAVMTTTSVCRETATETSYPKSHPDDKYACENANSQAECEAIVTTADPSVSACTYAPIAACSYTPPPQTGCVIRGCQEGYWNQTGADAELFECYIPVDEFVTSVCTKSVVSSDG